MTTAVNLCRDAHAWLAAHVQRTDAFWPIRLVRTNGHQINIHLVNVDSDLAWTLCRVNMEHDAAFATDLADARNILNDPNFILHMHYRDNSGVIAKRCLKSVKIKKTILERLKVGDLKTFSLQLSAGIQYRFVLGLQGNNVLALLDVELSSTLYREVVRLCSARGPHNFARISAEKLCHIFARLFNQLISVPTERVRP